MGMSDCSMCWETPCCCGYDFKNNKRYSSVEDMAQYLADILGYRSELEQESILQLFNMKMIQRWSKNKENK